jgi:Fe-S cluster assembly protein SufD
MSELTQQLASNLPKGNGAGPEWVQSMRETASGQFREFGLPTRRDEAWKYTSLRAFEQRGVQLPDPAEAPGSQFARSKSLLDTAYQVNMLDGQLVDQSGQLPAGLTVLPLNDALEQDNDTLRILLESLPIGQRGSVAADGFSSLNTATLERGLFIHVAAGVDAGSLALNWIADAHDMEILVNARLCLVLEEGAGLQLFEQFGNDTGNNCNIVVQADLAKRAGLSHIRFQQESADSVLITRTEVSQQSGSDYRYYGFDLGGGLVRHDLHSTLLGTCAKAALNGAYLLDGERHVDNHARVDHVAPACASEQYFRGVAGGSSRAVFNTAVCVHPGADETEASQSNANILLSKMAEVNTKPELEIYADEVVASHGATVGQLDELAVFYLRSRGLSNHDARQLLTMAFCRSVSDRLPNAALGETISARMMDVMPQAE